MRYRVEKCWEAPSSGETRPFQIRLGLGRDPKFPDSYLANWVYAGLTQSRQPEDDATHRVHTDTEIKASFVQTRLSKHPGGPAIHGLEPFSMRHLRIRPQRTLGDWQAPREENT